MITMSLCMIVKNEEKVLRRCLDSLKGLFEEIIIADTGSTDGTKEIALEYTDKVYDYEWIDDFADARNFVFSKATMEYIYSADADEMLDEKNRARFMKLKEALLPEVEIVQMWYVNTREYATTENFDKEYRPKLFRRLRPFTWIDAIHESVNLNPVVYDSDIEILHMPEGNHAGRDLRVFRKQIKQGRILSKKLLTMYARELFIAGEAEDFLAAEEGFFQMAMDLRRSPEELDYCYCVLARIWRLKNCPEEFFKWALKNLVISPCSEMCNEVGQFYFERGDYPEARIWFVNALQETKPILAAVYGDEIPAEMLDKCNEILAECNE